MMYSDLNKQFKGEANIQEQTHRIWGSIVIQKEGVVYWSAVMI